MTYRGDTSPVWPGVTYHKVEIVTTVVLLALGGVMFWRSFELGAGYGATGPQPGFWPFFLCLVLLLGLGVSLLRALRNPKHEPFFKVKQEVKDLAAVGTPILISVPAIHVVGMFVTAAVYMAFFMWWYESYRGWVAILSGLSFGVVLWVLLRSIFNLSMPMSWLYYQNITPF